MGKPEAVIVGVADAPLKDGKVLTPMSVHGWPRNRWAVGCAPDGRARHRIGPTAWAPMRPARGRCLWIPWGALLVGHVGLRARREC